jgi:hypothetical protein
MNHYSRKAHLNYNPVDLARMIDLAESHDVDLTGRYRIGSVQDQDNLAILQI